MNKTDIAFARSKSFYSFLKEKDVYDKIQNFAICIHDPRYVYIYCEKEEDLESLYDFLWEEKEKGSFKKELQNIIFQNPLNYVDRFIVCFLGN